MHIAQVQVGPANMQLSKNKDHARHAPIFLMPFNVIKLHHVTLWPQSSKTIVNKHTHTHTLSKMWK